MRVVHSQRAFVVFANLSVTSHFITTRKLSYLLLQLSLFPITLLLIIFDKENVLVLLLLEIMHME